MFIDHYFITKSRKLKIINDMVDIILNKYKAQCLQKNITQSSTNNNDLISLEIYVSKVSLQQVIKMNIEIAEELAHQDLAGITITPIFVLVDTTKIKTTMNDHKECEAHSHAD